MKRSLQLNPDNRPATWEQVKEWRCRHRFSPINTTYGSVDADPDSESAMVDALATFADRPDLIEGRIYWKMADNGRLQVTAEELADLLAQLRRERALRFAQLHLMAEQFRSDPPLLKYVKDIRYWLA